jgi:uncharacterized protein YjbJ (UPF0337 family)
MEAAISVDNLREPDIRRKQIAAEPVPFTVDGSIHRTYVHRARQVVMDKDRIAGAAKKIKGSIKQTIGKATGDAKLEAEGKADKVEGKVQNAIGGLKDALKK